MNNPTPSPTQAVCRHLRHKGMYVYTDGNLPGEDQQSAICWCLRSMKDHGPDDRFVDKADCCDPARSCYEAP